MKNKIIATSIAINMILSCSPVFAKDDTYIIKNVNDVQLWDNPVEVSFNTSDPDIFKGNPKLKKSTVEFSKDSLKNTNEKIKSRLKANSMIAEYEQTTDSQVDIDDDLDNTNTTTDSAVTINDSPDNAYIINVGNVYSDRITGQGEERWYAFSNTSKQKLTVITQAQNSSNIDYNLYLFKYNEQTNNLDLVANSSYPSTANEQLSAVGEQGVYFIGVNSAQGFDNVNPFNFVVIPSTQYGDNEPDDNIFQADQKSGYKDSVSIQDTIDNTFDEDWSKVSITNPSNVFIGLTNVATENAYKAEIVGIINNQLKTLKTIDANSNGTILLPAGTYYVRIKTNGGFDDQQKYNFTLKADKIFGLSPDGKYVLTTDSNQNLYLNGKKVEVNWERKYYFAYPDGGYVMRDQNAYQRSDSILQGAVYGTYTSSYTGTINHAFSLVIYNPHYFYWYSRYYNGGGRDHDQINEPIPWAVSLIIDADTGKIVDLNDDNLNFYYSNNIESHKFTAMN